LRGLVAGGNRPVRGLGRKNPQNRGGGVGGGRRGRVKEGSALHSKGSWPLQSEKTGLLGCRFPKKKGPRSHPAGFFCNEIRLKVW